MAVDNPNVVDGMAFDKERNALVMLLTDSFKWVGGVGEDILPEYNHLLMLQEKLNSYISFIEEKQYISNFPEAEVEMSVIEIHFMYDITENCKKFLQTVQQQISELKIKIEAYIGQN